MISAKVIEKLPKTQGVGQKGNWEKIGLVVETTDKYPKTIMIENFKQVELLENLPIGSKIQFELDVSSREYNGKYYHNVMAYNISVLSAPKGQNIAPIENPDDLPF